jgi:hypothetical protein
MLCDVRILNSDSLVRSSDLRLFKKSSCVCICVCVIFLTDIKSWLLGVCSCFHR